MIIEALSADQEAGLEVFRQFMADPKAKSMSLKGFAGVGKTTLVQFGVQELSGFISVAFTAPTNKATKVLRHMAVESGTPVDHVATIYSLLGLRLMPNGEVKTINRGAESLAAAFGLIVLDEASMANDSLMNFIDEDTGHTNTKVLRMGDPLQLPPIGEERSRAFDDCDYSVILTEIVRQAEGNPIIQLTADIRQTIEEGGWLPKLETIKGDNGEGIYVLPKAKWLSWMRAGFNSEAYRKDGDAFRAVAWRNVTVNHYNERIRDALYGEQAKDPFIVGERVFNAAPIADELDEDAPAITTDSEGVVKSVEIGVHPIAKKMNRGEYKVYHLSIWYEDVGLVDAYVIHPDSEDDMNRKLKKYSTEAKKNKRLWGTFWAFKDGFHDVRPAHAITSHRSQGSTYKTCFVDVGDIMRNKNHTEGLKSLYVSCSRASENLILLL